MKIQNPLRGRSGRRIGRKTSASADAARRAMRARDHLERKRAQQRRRRERERAQIERIAQRSPLRRASSLLLFAIALTLGMYAAAPLNDRSVLGPRAFAHVDVQGASTLTAEEIVARAGLAERRAPGELVLDRIVAAIEAEPWIESARALWLPTGALMISVVERDPIAIWQADAESAPLLVDRSGEPFGGDVGPAGALPRVNGPPRHEGAPLPDAAVEILTALARFSSLSDDRRTLILHLPTAPVAEDEAIDDPAEASGYVVQLGSEGPRALLGRRLFTERVARLAALVENGEPILLGARWIDLRYADRAVLRTEPVSG